MEFEAALSDRSQWSIDDACSMTRALEVLSTKTAFQVLRELFFGTVRFDDFVTRIESSAPSVSRALKQLETAGIVTRVPYQAPGQRARDEYRLTEAGEDLLPAFVALVQWGDKRLPGRPRTPSVPRRPHRAAGRREGHGRQVRRCRPTPPTSRSGWRSPATG